MGGFTGYANIIAIGLILKSWGTGFRRKGIGERI
jgi:hypothetical protein